MGDNEIEVKVTADGGGVKPGLDDATQNVHQFAESSGEAIEKLKEQFIELFAFEKMKEFCTDAIEEFAKVERGMNTLGAQVRSNGGDWEKLKDGVDAFLVSQAQLYDESVTDMLPVLNNLEVKTKNLTVSMKLLDDANKLAAMGIGDLKGNAEALALAYNGNSRGLMQLGRLLGLTRDQAKDAGLVFDTLGKKMDAAGVIVGDTTNKIGMMRSGWEEFKEYVGGTLAPLLDVFGAVEKVVVNIFQTIFALAKEVVDVFLMVTAVTAHDLDGVRDAWNQMKQDAKDYGRDVAKVWEDTTQTIKLETDNQIAIEAKANKKKADVAKATAKETAKAQKSEITSVEKEVEKAFKRMGTEVGQGMELLSKDLIKAAKSGGDAWKSLAEDMAKWAIESIGQQLMMAGEAMIAQSVAATNEAASQLALTNPATAALAPGLLMEGGLKLEAAGGAIYGAAEVALAEGGIVHSPTIALIGENGPEKVTPLGKGDDGFHIHGGISLAFPGVRRASDFNQSEQTNAARSFVKVLDETKRRSGLRNSPI